MWIEELPNGKFKYVERYTDNDGKTRKVSMTHTKNSNRVKKEMLLALQDKINAKLATKSGEFQTFEEVSGKWFKVWKKTVRSSTSKDREMKLRVINRELGEYRLSNLTAGIINRYILDLFENGYSIVALKIMYL